MFHNADIHMYGTGTIGQKGQIVVPAKARKELGIKQNEEFVFVGHGPMIHLIRAREFDRILDRMTKKFSQGLSVLQSIKKKK
jgi:AbrB family looped-hinge helix DNA binding protein